MPVTLRDIARRANVSHATVSVVLNQRSVPIISERTRQRVLKVAEELGYQPNHLARALATGRSHIIAVWVVEPYNPYAAQTLGILQALLRSEPFDLMVVEAIAPSSGLVELPSRSHWPVDGVLAVDCPWRVATILAAGHNAKTPIVSMGRSYSTATDFVGVDVGSGVREAVEHLISAGRRNITLLTVRDQSASDPVNSAYRNSITEAGLTPDFLEAHAPSRVAGVEAVERRVQQGDCPDAIIAYNDLLCVGALKALRNSRFSIPGDVAVISCVGTDELQYHDPALTVIDHPLQQMCATGWQFLQARLNAPELPPQQVMLQSQLTIRASSAS